MKTRDIPCAGSFDRISIFISMYNPNNHKWPGPRLFKTNDVVSLPIVKTLIIKYAYIEDIYSFAVNTINIVIACNENISIFTTAKHEWKFECFNYTRWKFLWFSLEKSKFSFYLIVFTPMRASEVINNVTKQNMNVMASTLSA